MGDDADAADQIAAREKFDFVVNGDFFKARGVNDGEGTNAIIVLTCGRCLGPAVTDGKTWSTSTNAGPVWSSTKTGR